MFLQIILLIHRLCSDKCFLIAVLLLDAQLRFTEYWNCDVHFRPLHCSWVLLPRARLVLLPYRAYLKQSRVLVAMIDHRALGCCMISSLALFCLNHCCACYELDPAVDPATQAFKGIKTVHVMGFMPLPHLCTTESRAYMSWSWRHKQACPATFGPIVHSLLLVKVNSRFFFFFCGGWGWCGA